METVKRSFSGVAGIVRLAILVILIAAIAFFIIRFFNSRNDTKKAEQAVQTAQNDTKKEDTRATEENSERAARDSDRTNSNPQPQVPSGIDDAESLPNVGPAAIPEVGINPVVFLQAVALSGLTYIITKKAFVKQD